MVKLGLVGAFLLVTSATLIWAKPWNLLKTNSKSNCQVGCTASDPNKLNVHIVPHSHDDVGWLKTVDQYYYGGKNYIQRAGVQYIIDSVIAALRQNPQRRFIQVETAFFHKWWKRQDEDTRDLVRHLVNNGQLEIVGGGWSMNDEAAVHYQSVIDQFSYGLRVINDTLGECARPRTGWQIDPFGHSREMASIFAQMGYDGQFFARVDWRDKVNRMKTKSMEMLWESSPNLGNEANLFTGVLFNHYSAPRGFCFDILCQDEPIIDDASIPDYNYEAKIMDFAEFIKEQADSYLTNNIMITMGDDFNYGDALSYFRNLDLVVEGFQKFKQYYNDKEINVFYSTPTCYIEAINDYLLQNGVELPTKSDDFFPYATDYHAYWSGYYTSRPTSKRFERQGNNLLQVAKQIGVYSKMNESSDGLVDLKEAMGIMQHHDAITGTEKQHVADDYARIVSDAFNSTLWKTSTNILTLLKKTSDASLDFSSCLLSNMSYCPHSMDNAFIVTLYNPLAQTRTEYVRLPVNTITFAIKGPDGQDVPYDVFPAIDKFGFLPLNTGSYDLVFQAVDIPPHGFKTYYVSVDGSKKSRLVEPSLKGAVKLGNDRAGFTINENTGLLNSITINARTINVSQELMYYIAAEGDNSAFEKRASGAYIFRPSPNHPDALSFASKVETTVYKGSVVDEVHQVYNDWIKQIIRVYEGGDNIEFDWLVGPIDISDNSGKEVISRFRTNVENGDLFYTDSNGREMLERKINFRPTFNYSNEEPNAGNYYPVNARITLKDPTSNIQLSVLNDRSQGGSSLQSGEVELMVHRRLRMDDAFGVGEALNEEAYGQGLVARGQHFVTLRSTSDSANERILAHKKLLQPWVFLSNASGLTWENLNTDFKLELSGLKGSLPENVNILTLEPWSENGDKILLRLEHIFEKNDDPVLSKDVSVDLQEIFSGFNILTVEEMTLDGNLPLAASKRAALNKSVVERKGDLKAFEVVLSPMEIRTFVATIQHV